MLAIADASCLQGDTRQSYEMYNKIISMNYSESYSEGSLLREQMINDDVSPDLFYSLLYSGTSDSLKVESIRESKQLEGARASLTYLNAMMEARLSQDSIAITLFREIDANDLDQRLHYYLKKRMAAHYFRLHQYETAKRELWEAMNDAPTENALANLRERIDLCESIEMQLH